MAAFLGFLRSPLLALGVLLFLALYTEAAAWMPPTLPGAAAGIPFGRALGLDRPFASAPFLLALSLLLINTLACTWDRTRRTAALWKGHLPVGGLLLEGAPVEFQRAFLKNFGFREKGDRLFRFRPALWGGWLFHAGLLLLLAAVAAQQTLHESGTFELAEGEWIRLDQTGAIRDRVSGLFAPDLPPPLEVGLVGFDHAVHRRGFSPDRRSRLVVKKPDRKPMEVVLDRSTGVSCGGVTVYQAIPTGAALVLEIPGLGTRALHLYGEGRKARVEVFDPVGVPTVFSVEAERDLEDPLGTGPLKIRVERAGAAIPLALGQSFPFGNGNATLVGITRWSAYTYSRSPGIPWVFGAFAVILGASLLMVFPAGAAALESNKGAYRVYTSRGGELLWNEWVRRSEIR